MSLRKSESGQLLLPILSALFLFGLFWVTFVLWCRQTYWQMRMDMAADATALSAMREEALLLNTVGTLQYLENPLLQKVRIWGDDVAAVQRPSVNSFDKYNFAMTTLVDRTYEPYAMYVATLVARANGADGVPVPIPPPQHHLVGKDMFVHYLLHGVIPTGGKRYRAAYYTRDWWPRKTAPQPPHRETWTVCHDGICQKGKAQLWLDVKSTNFLNNGGFPSDYGPWWRGLGIQCNFPQFNARLMPKTAL